MVIAPVVTPDGLPLAYEVLPGNTADCKTLKLFLDRIAQQYGRARRVWVMDRGMPTEAVLAEMRAGDPPVQYLVGTPKGRLSRLEKPLLAKTYSLQAPSQPTVLAWSRRRIAQQGCAEPAISRAVPHVSQGRLRGVAQRLVLISAGRERRDATGQGASVRGEIHQRPGPPAGRPGFAVSRSLQA